MNEWQMISKFKIKSELKIKCTLQLLGCYNFYWEFLQMNFLSHKSYIIWWEIIWAHLTQHELCTLYFDHKHYEVQLTVD